MNYPPYEPRDIFPVDDSLEIDDTIFKTYTWNVPEGVEWKGRVVFVHGYKDSFKTYHRHFEYFAKNGYDVFFFYQRGEGETKLKNGQRGIATDFYAYKGVDDMIEFNINLLKSQNKPLNIHLMGHSMGGGIVINYAITGKYLKDIKSFSTFAPLVTLHKNTDPGLPTEYLVRFLCLTSFGCNLRVPTPLKPNYLTSDPKMAKFIEDNVDISNSDGAFVETRDFILRGKHLLKPKLYTKLGKDVPLLICHGDDDSINDFQGSQKFIDSVNSIDGMQFKEIKIYPNGRHCLHVEMEEIALPMAKDMLDFINKFN